VKLVRASGEAVRTLSLFRPAIGRTRKAPPQILQSAR
jgi:hypothetical protein